MLKIRREFINFIAEDILEDFDLQDVIDYSYELKNESEGEKRSNYGGWHSSNVETKEGRLKPLFDEIQTRLDELHIQLGFKTTKKQSIRDCWININYKNSQNVIHMHPRSFFSGCFYVKVPENSGSIVFNTPMKTLSWVIHTNDIEVGNAYNTSQVVIKPKTGMLLFFPSWLEHYVQPNESDEDRISIAFNTVIEKIKT